MILQVVRCKESMAFKEPEIYISSIRDFLQKDFYKQYKNYSFSIPEYQRPYKWTDINVCQLIDDIHENIICKEEKNIEELKYRIGTIVLHVDNNNLNIVDGQQRFLTINLILRALCRYFDDKNEIQQYISVFTEKFSSIETKRNLRTNYETIINKFREIADLNLLYKIYNFLLYNCEFVIVVLFDITEAFQFFDSQNSRGKDLEPYDLLKAYHLRAIKETYETDFKNLKNLEKVEKQTIQKWEKLVSSGELKGLFRLLFHIRAWEKLYYQYFFTKSNISIFKGYTKKKDSSLPPNFYFSSFIQTEIIRNNNNEQGNNYDIPFQIDMPILNGEYFFYEIYHYYKIYTEFLDYLKHSKTNNEITNKIIKFLNTYQYRNRKGDQYLKHLFDCICVFYIGKFGYEQIENVLIKLFQWVYMLRISQSSIRREIILNHSISGTSGFNNLFRKIKESDIVKDIILASPFTINSFDFEIKCNIKTNKELISLLSNTLNLIKEPEDE